jgi:hypothetical protein
MLLDSKIKAAVIILLPLSADHGFAGQSGLVFVDLSI